MQFPGSRATHSMVVAYRLSYSEAYGVFLDQGSNLCLLRWQADSLPLSHQESLNNLSGEMLEVFTLKSGKKQRFPLSVVQKYKKKK